MGYAASCLGASFAAGLVAACSFFLESPDLVGPSDAGLVDVLADAPQADVDAGAPADGAISGDACLSSDPSLVAWFPFDGDGGVLTRDCSKRNLQATSIGSTPAKPAEGRIGGAIDLDGLNTCLDFGTAVDFAFEGKPFSVAAWIKPRQWAEANNTGRWFFSREAAGLGWHVGTDDPQQAELDMTTDAGKIAVSSAVPATWTHVVFVYDPGNLMLAYVNGVNVRMKTTGVPTKIGASPTTRVHVGCGSPSSNRFDGLVDDLRVYSRVLSPAEVQALATP